MRELDGGEPVLELTARELVLLHPAIQIQLDTMNELRAMALLLGRPIVHSDMRSRHGWDGYYVFDGPTAYMYYQK